MILAGDIGGTHARLGLFEVAGLSVKQVHEHVYQTRDHPNLESVIHDFLAAPRDRAAPVEAACFGVAGPVRSGRVQMPNAGWAIDAASLAREIGIGRASVINDLQANAYGLATLDAKDFLVLNSGDPDPSGNQAVVSAGTGLGEAGLYFDDQLHRPFATEGGHADFAPTNADQAALLEYLRAEYGHVSTEHVLSGPGLFNIYRFLRDSGRGEEPDWLAQSLASGDASAAISQAALANKSPLCESALKMFVAIYGAEAGNVALRMMATAGIFIGGGIAVKIASELKRPAFMSAFTAKGRMREMMEKIPVRIVMNDSAALYGAARAAALERSAT